MNLSQCTISLGVKSVSCIYLDHFIIPREAVLIIATNNNNNDNVYYTKRSRVNYCYQQ